MAKRFAAPFIVTLAILLAGCTASGGQERIDISVFVAASLHQVIVEIADAFEQDHAEIKVALNAAGSQTLRMQIEHGADADIFISADERHMSALSDNGLVEPPSVVAYNRMVVMAYKTADITKWQDIGTKDIKLALADADVPAGKYAIDILDDIQRDLPGFKQMAMDNVITYEMSVSDVAQKVALGEADAGMVYATDVRSVDGSRVRLVDIPEQYNVTGVYPAAVIKSSEHKDAANTFMQFILSDNGQKTLKRLGFIPASDD